MWKIIGCNINFSFDDGTMICNNAVDIMTGQRYQLLQFLGLMNSKLFDWYLKVNDGSRSPGRRNTIVCNYIRKNIGKVGLSIILKRNNKSAS